MGQVLHGSATTTEAVRRAIQHSQASLRTLAKRFGINQKTVAKWEQRTSVVDLAIDDPVWDATVFSKKTMKQAINQRARWFCRSLDRRL